LGVTTIYKMLRGAACRAIYFTLMKSLIILGRQPALGLAELESILGAEALQPIGREAVLTDVDAKDIKFELLGGSVKLAKLLTELPANWNDIEKYLSDMIPKHLQYVPEGKFKLGLSTYGLRVRPQQINATALRLKKIIKAEGRSVRIVPNKATSLNSAQVLHNQLTSPTGWELVLVRHGDKALLAQTIAEQNIEAYARRDQSRPMRDAKVGMLPPKLAQIIINLTCPEPGDTLLDPFCGTGVVLQEAALAGLEVYGTDIDERMISFAKENLRWLHNTHNIEIVATIEQGDATTHTWTPPISVVACETYLGKPLSSLPPQKILEQIRAECDAIHEKFLRSIGSQLSSGARLCLAVPAWRLKNGFLHLKTLDRTSELGYNRLKFVHAGNEELIYHREDQTVARELVVLEKK
jgi:tRNA G10  N-methylase Trm11